MDLWPELLLVAELDGRLLGYALGGLGQDSSQGWLLSLAVLPEARGFGLAERMMLRVEQALAGLRVERVRLTVDPVNPAQRLYFRLGYVQLSEERDYFGPGEDRLLLEKRLG
ncbi:Acetyltransferase YpeA [compost metagenome]